MRNEREGQAGRLRSFSGGSDRWEGTRNRERRPAGRSTSKRGEKHKKGGRSSGERTYASWKFIADNTTAFQKLALVSLGSETSERGRRERGESVSESGN